MTVKSYESSFKKMFTRAPKALRANWLKSRRTESPMVSEGRAHVAGFPSLTNQEAWKFIASRISDNFEI